MNLNLIQRMRGRGDVVKAAADLSATQDEAHLEAEERDDDEAKAKAAEDEDETEAKKAAEDDDKETDAAKAKKAEGDDEDESDDDMKADAVTIATMCAEAGHPSLVASLLASGATIGQVRQRIEAAGEITKVFAHAAKANPQIDAGLAATLIADGSTVETARKVASAMLVSAQSPEIRNSHAPGAGDGCGASVDHGWKRSMAKVNARIN